MPTLMLLALLAAAPKPSDGVRAAFINGDLPQAEVGVQLCLKKEPKARCKQLGRWLAEYTFLYSHLDSFKPEDARTFIELDKKLSPKQRSRLTEHAIERYVNKPFETAKALAEGNQKRALELLDVVLTVDPTHAEALALKKALLARDAGTP